MQSHVLKSWLPLRLLLNTKAKGLGFSPSSEAGSCSIESIRYSSPLSMSILSSCLCCSVRSERDHNTIHASTVSRAKRVLELRGYEKAGFGSRTHLWLFYCQMLTLLKEDRVFNRVEGNNLPTQVRPSVPKVYPAKHSHRRPPSSFRQSWEHSPLFVRHSLISRNCFFNLYYTLKLCLFI